MTHGRLLITFLAVSELQVSCANDCVIFRFVVIYLIIILLISAHTCSHCSGIPMMRHKPGIIVPTRSRGAPWSAPLECGNQDFGEVLYYTFQTSRSYVTRWYVQHNNSLQWSNFSYFALTNVTPMPDPHNETWGYIMSALYYHANGFRRIMCVGRKYKDQQK